MAHIIYTPTKSEQNENGNYCWGYKDFEAIKNVISYILSPNFPIIDFKAIGLPISDIEEMALLIDNYQKLFKKDTGRRIRHETLTFDSKNEFIRPDGQNMLLTIAYACACYYYSMGFPTIYSIWSNDKNSIRGIPEIHFAISTVSIIDGHKYHINLTEKAQLEQYFNSLICYYTSNLFKMPLPPFDEPDYSDFMYYPVIMTG